MENAEEIRRKLDKVKEMKSYTEALSVLADIQFEIGIESCRERKELRSEILNLKRKILGNGEPENSIMVRLKNVEDCIYEFGKDTKNDIALIKSKLIGNLNLDKKGLIDRVDSLCDEIDAIKEAKKEIKNVKWAAITFVVLQVLSFILSRLF